MTSISGKAVQKCRDNNITLIDKNNEDPEYIASLAFKKAIFGSHPYKNESYGEKDDLGEIDKRGTK